MPRSAASDTEDGWVTFSCSAEKRSTIVDVNFSKNGNRILFKSPNSGLVDTYNDATIGIEPSEDEPINATSESMEYFNFSWVRGLPSLDWQDKMNVHFVVSIKRMEINLKVGSAQTVTFGPRKDTLDSGTYRGACSISGLAVKEQPKVVEKVRTIKEAFLDFDANGRINIQNMLSDLKFYNSSIDGSYGPSTEEAITTYLVYINAPLKTKEEVISALKELITEQVESDELAIVLGELSANNSLLAAQIILNNVEEFLKSGTGSFDLNFVKKYAAIKEVGKGKWNSNLESKFANFKSYVYENEDFKEYSEEQKNRRETESNVALEGSKQQLKDLKDNLKIWLQSNLLHDKAGNIYDQVVACEEALESNDIQEIQQATIKAAKLARIVGLLQ